MSQTKVSNWPDAPSTAVHTSKSSEVIPFSASEVIYTASGPYSSSVTQAPKSLVRTMRVTITSTIVHTPNFKILKTSLIRQTRPLDLHAPSVTTETQSVLPDITVASFDLHTPPVDPPISADVTKSNFGPTPTANLIQNHYSTSLSGLSSRSIAGITLGAVAFIGVLVSLALFAHCHRRAKKQTDTETLTSQDILEAKMQRARDLGMQRRSARMVVANKERLQTIKTNNAAATEQDVTEVTCKDVVADGVESDGTTESIGVVRVVYDQGRRRSGLAMHPPSLSVAQFDAKSGSEIGRAI